jgi:hypothetical protein
MVAEVVNLPTVTLGPLHSNRCCMVHGGSVSVGVLSAVRILKSLFTCEMQPASAREGTLCKLRRQIC